MCWRSLSTGPRPAQTGCGYCANRTLDLVAGEHVVGVDDAIRVALLGKESLAMCGVILVERVARHDRIETRSASIVLGSQYPAETLGFFLARPERSRHLDRYRCLRQVDREVRHFRDDERRDLAGAERVVQSLALLHRRVTLDDRDTEALAQFVELVEILADDRQLVADVAAGGALDPPLLCLGRRREPVALLRFGGRVQQPL